MDHLIIWIGLLIIVVSLVAISRYSRQSDAGRGGGTDSSDWVGGLEGGDSWHPHSDNSHHGGTDSSGSHDAGGFDAGGGFDGGGGHH